MLVRSTIGEVLKDLRLEQGKTLRTISADARVALGYLSELERGQKEASSEILDALAFALGVPTYQIIVEAGYRMMPSVELDKRKETLYTQYHNVNHYEKVG